MLTEFESVQTCSKTNDNRHHEKYLGVQEAFLKEVKSLVSIIEEMGNPFMEQGEELLVLDTRDILDTSVGEKVRKAEMVGEEQHQIFVEERLIKCDKPVTHVISKNKLQLFNHKSAKYPSKHKTQVAALTNDCNLFSRLYLYVKQGLEIWICFCT